MNGKNYSEEIKKLLIQNSKSIDERFLRITVFHKGFREETSSDTQTVLCTHI